MACVSFCAISFCLAHNCVAFDCFRIFVYCISQNLGKYPVDCVKWKGDTILLLLSIFGGVYLPAYDRHVAAEASCLRAPVLAIRDSHISESNGGTVLAQLCMEEGCFEEILLGLEFSRFSRPSYLELVMASRS